jgi:hypothetical protein
MDLRLVMHAEVGEDDQEVAEWAGALVSELSDVAGVTVDSLQVEAPEGSKGLGAMAGALVAKAASAAATKTLMDVLRKFVARTNRTVEVSIDGDVLKLSGVSREVQQQLIESWLARHPGT